MRSARRRMKDIKNIVLRNVKIPDHVSDDQSWYSSSDFIDLPGRRSFLRDKPLEEDVLTRFPRGGVRGEFLGNDLPCRLHFGHLLPSLGPRGCGPVFGVPLRAYVRVALK